MQIAGATAVITGASSGIGAALARMLGAKGANVVLLGRSEARLEQVAGEIQSLGGSGACYPADLGDPHAAAHLASNILSAVGTPDLLVNNAGAGRWLSVEETDAHELEQMMALPYFAAFNLTRGLLAAMKEKGTGRIVNVTSVGSRIVWPGATAYIAARWAMMGFNEALRAELYRTGITVTLAMFGTVESGYWTHNPASRERVPKMAKMAPVLTPEQAAAAIVRGIERNKRLVLRPRIFRFIFLMNALFPRTTESLMCQTGWRPPTGTGKA